MSPPNVGDLNPAVSKKLGLDERQAAALAAELGTWEGRILPVTFSMPPPRQDGKKDPIAYLPPEYRGFGILDRNYRDRVAIGESWLVEVTVTEGTGTKFLIPLARLDVRGFLDLQPELLLEIANHLSRQSPELATALASKLPAASNPELEKKMEEATATIHRLETMNTQLAKDKAGLETKVDQLRAHLTETATSAPETRGPPSDRIVGRALSPHSGEDRVTSGGDDERGLVRITGDIVESPRLIHSAYEVYFTPDFYRVYLRPSSAGIPCESGRLVIPGLAEVDPSPAPASYPLSWDMRQGAFSVYIGGRGKSEV